MGLATGLVPVCLREIGEKFDLNLTQKGTISVVMNIALGLALLAGAYLINFYHKKSFLVAGTYFIALGVAGMSFSPSFSSFLAASFLFGAGLGCLETSISPLVADLSPGESGKHLNRVHGFYPFGVVTAAILVSAMLYFQARPAGRAPAAIAWRLPFLGTAVLALLVALIYQATPFHDRTREGSEGLGRIRGFLATGSFIALCLVILLAGGVEGGITFWTSNFIQDSIRSSVLSGGLGVGIFAGFMMIGRFISSHYAGRLGLARIMIVCSLVGTAAAAIVALSTNLVLIWIALGVAGVCVGPLWPSTLALSVERIPGGSPTTILPLLSLAGVLGFGFYPWFVGIIGDLCGLRVGLGLLPLSFLVLLLLVFAAPGPHPHRLDSDDLKGSGQPVQ